MQKCMVPGNYRQFGNPFDLGYEKKTSNVDALKGSGDSVLEGI